MKKRYPDAYCCIKGSMKYASVEGMVFFYETEDGILIEADVKGLPMPNRISCNQPIFGFHIHTGGVCKGTRQEPFKDVLGHFNPNDCPHPYHAGDLPPLFANKEGMAMMSVMDDRFTMHEIIGKTMIIHAGPDDFHTQPSGNSGSMIACGKIKYIKD